MDNQFPYSRKQIAKLKRDAIVTGFDSNEQRTVCWQILVGLDPMGSSSSSPSPPTLLEGGVADNSYIVLRDMEIIRCDVARSLWKAPGIDTEEDRATRRMELTSVITSVLQFDPSLSYFQGFHDMCTVFLLVCGQEVATKICRSLATTTLRELFHSDLRYVEEIMRFVHHVVQEEDEELGDHLAAADLASGHYALPWILTWFAHSVDDDFPTLARVYDFILGTDPLFMPVMLSAALVLRHKEYLMCHSDLCSLYVALSKLVQVHGLDAEELLPEAKRLFVLYPRRVLLQSPCRADRDLCFLGGGSTSSTYSDEGGRVGSQRWWSTSGSRGLYYAVVVVASGAIAAISYTRTIRR